jgi:hypothetical protein
MKLPEAFYSHDGHNFAGGVELAFMSTSYDINVAIEYGGRGHYHYHHDQHHQHHQHHQELLRRVQFLRLNLTEAIEARK